MNPTDQPDPKLDPTFERVVEVPRELALAKQMGHRHDPCAPYTLLAVKNFIGHGEKLHCSKFTAQGKFFLLASPAKSHRK